MHARRWPSPPTLSLLPRDSIDPSSYAPIDSLLKDLKSCSRRLQTAFSAYHDELQMLERLYYKGKNQHRSALFWKRAVEMKRYGERLDAMGLADIFALFRCSFFGAISIQNPKSIRGSWTHVPNSTYVIFFAERLAACLTLVNKFHESLLQIYRSFKLSMQSGAFVQLILTLAAVAARMVALIPEFQDVLQLSWAISNRILLILDPGQARRVKPLPVNNADTHYQSTPVIVLDMDNEVNEAEDMGSAVARPALSPPLFQKDMTPPHEHSVTEFDSIILSDDTFRLGTGELLRPGVSGQGKIERKVVPKRPVKMDKLSKRSRKGEETWLPEKKVKMKRDEIDDIFGF